MVMAGAAGALAEALPRLVIAGHSDPADLPGAAPVNAQAWHEPGEAVSARCSVVDGRHRVDVPGLVTFSFETDAREVRALAHPPARPEAIQEVFGHSVLPLVLQALGTEVLHASAVVTSRGVVAFCGASGIGKSTVAYGLHRRGYPLRADDAVALRPSAVAVEVIPLPFDVRLRPAAALFFGHGARSTRLAGAPALAVREDGEPARLAAVCILERVSDAGGTAVELLRPSAAFAALLPHAYCFDPSAAERKRRMLGRYLDLAARLPVFRVPRGDDLGTLAPTLDAIERILAGAS
jgi:hypothetical protein